MERERNFKRLTQPTLNAYVYVKLPCHFLNKEFYVSLDYFMIVSVRLGPPP